MDDTPARPVRLHVLSVTPPLPFAPTSDSWSSFVEALSFLDAGRWPVLIRLNAAVTNATTECCRPQLREWMAFRRGGGGGGFNGTDGESGYQDISVAMPESAVSSSALRLYRIFFMLV
jgi:hypothetical protein